MEGYHIKGGKVLNGKVKVDGAKNAVLPIMAAAVMTTEENIFMSCPDISDIKNMKEILRALGCKVSQDQDVMTVDATDVNCCSIPNALMKEMRSSVFLAGSLLTRCGRAVISDPGGCDIGKRPIDIHIAGLKRLGVSVVHAEDRIIMSAGKMRGADIVFPYPSVGATENIMMAALGARGKTRIINAAREPEIVDLQAYLNKCGADIRGAGTSVITVEAKGKLRGCAHRMMPDRIEAGTYLLMALGTGGRIMLEGIGGHLIRPVTDLLTDCGYHIEDHNTYIYASASGAEKCKCSISTGPYPGFPTDMQPQLVTFLTKCGKGSVIEENIFEKRFEYVEQLKKMGADIEISGKKVIINNNNILCGAKVEAKDLRGGAALMIAGIMADGETLVTNTKYIKRGYSRPEEKIKGLGGEITYYGS